MFNEMWENPFRLLPQVKGTYTFWHAPVATEKSGIQKDFNMVIEVRSESYEPTAKVFSITLLSENRLIDKINKENIIYIEDIFISKGNRRGGNKKNQHS